MGMFCRKCGNKCLDDAVFCSSCGESLSAPKKKAAPPSKTLTSEELAFSYIQNARNQSIKTTSALKLSPPPSALPNKVTEDYKNNDVLKASASGSGYYYYDRNATGASADTTDNTTRIVTIVSMIFVFLMVGGPAVKGYLTAFTAFRKVSGEYHSEKFKYGLEMPDGWKAVKNPRKILKAQNAAGYFTKGNPLNPMVQMLIYYGANAASPEDISSELLDYIEPEIKRNNEYYAEMMGMKYELLSLDIVQINNRDAIWIEGNTWCMGCEVKRDFTFYAFGDKSSYFIKFVLKEQQVDEYWPEIQSILDSIVFE